MSEEAPQEQEYTFGERLLRLNHTGPGSPLLLVRSTARAHSKPKSPQLVLVETPQGEKYWEDAADLARTTVRRPEGHFVSRIAEKLGPFAHGSSDMSYDDRLECAIAAGALLFAQASESQRVDILKALRYHRVILRERVAALGIAEGEQA